MRGDPLDGCQKGSGIRVGRAASTTSGTATITNNTISDYQKTGIIVDGPARRRRSQGTRSPASARRTRSPRTGCRSAAAQSPPSPGTGSAGTRTRARGHVDRDAPLRLARQGDRLRQHVHRERSRHLRSRRCCPAGEATAVRTNTISGGNFGISVTGPTTAVLIERTRSRAPPTPGSTSASNAAGNLLRGNKASGADPNTAGEFDCHDRSVGSRSRAPTTSGSTTPARSRSLPGSARRSLRRRGPSVEVEPPQVIVLPPSPPNGPVVQPPQPAVRSRKRRRTR